MKKITCIIIIMIIISAFSTNLFSETHIYNEYMSGTWTLEGSPYIVHGVEYVFGYHIILAAGFDIEPGVIVNVLNDTRIEILENTSLTISGTEENPIIFNNPYTIQYIGNDTEDEDTPWSIFSYCHINESSHDAIKIGEHRWNIRVEHCIIDGSGSSGIHSYGKQILVNNNTITNYHNGIFMHGCVGPYFTNKIENNYIENNDIGIISQGSTVIINNNIITSNTNMSHEGGGLRLLSQVIMENNLIINNSAEYGGGIYFSSSYENVGNGGEGIRNSIIRNNTFYNNTADHGSSIYGNVGDNFNGNDPIYDTPTFINNIFWDESTSAIIVNLIPPDNTGSAFFYYNCIQSGNTNILLDSGITTNTNKNTISDYPQFEDPGNVTLYPETHGYGLTDLSPCVDTGDPSYPPDPDGTTIEMGCYYFPHPLYDIHHLSKGFNWESFPRIETNPNLNNAEDADLVGVLNNIDPFIGSIDFINMQADDDNDPELTYDRVATPRWDPDEYPAQSSWLYKIEVLPSEERLLIVEGTILPDDFTLEDEDPLEEGTYHWLGFWLPRNQKMIESFGTYWSKVDKVKSEDWFYSPANSQRGDPTNPITLDAENLILQSGKGYMVLFKDLEGEPITDFHWTLTSAAEEPEKKAESENFIYTEKADYEAIDVFNIPPNVSEIGVFEDGVCVGAIVVEDTCAQILVYSDNANRSPIPFTLEVVTGRGISTPINDYQVLNLQTGKYETKSIFSGRQEYSVIRFGEDEPQNEILSTPQLHGNYPNPFNPTTTISFSLPEEQEIELSIYNIKGQKVKQLINGQLTAGQHSMIWNGKDTNDKSVCTGIYFYKLKTGNDVLTRKMLMLK